MPRFLDHHDKMPPMPPEAMEQGKKMMEQMKADIKAKKADKFGVTPVNVFMGANGETWCLTDGPNADAVIKAHEAKGAKLTKKDIVEVTPLV